MPRKKGKIFREEVEEDFEEFRNTFESKANDQNSMLTAIRHENLGQLRNLLARGVDSNFCDRYGLSPLHIATEMPPTPENENFRYKNALLGLNGLSIFVKGCKENHEALELLVYSGAPLERQDRFGLAPLHNACSHSAKAVSLLLNAGSPFNCQDNAGRTPLMLACESKHDEAVVIIQSLLDWGANLKLKDEDGKTALHYLVDNSAMTQTSISEMVYRFLYAGVQVNVADNSGETPLSAAFWRLMMFINLRSQESDLAVMIALIRGGAFVHFKNFNIYDSILRKYEHILLHFFQCIEPYMTTSQMASLYRKFKEVSKREVDHNNPNMNPNGFCKMLLQFILTSSHSVRSLKCSSRAVIRKTLGDNPFPHADKLDLPCTLVEYLKCMV